MLLISIGNFIREYRSYIRICEELYSPGSSVAECIRDRIAQPEQRTGEIKTLMKRAAQDIIDIGQKLIEVKLRLGHGHFQSWTRHEFGWSYETAARFMRVADQFKTVNLTDMSIAPSALYLLAAPSTPEPAAPTVAALVFGVGRLRGRCSH